MDSRKDLLIECVLFPLAAGLTASVAAGGMGEFRTLMKPPFTPPGWLFPVVWTVLYLMMGLASYLVLTSGDTKARITKAAAVYLLQLAVNFCWPVFFFRFHWYLFSFVWLALLWVLVWRCGYLFKNSSRAAGWLLFPYLAWVTFAGWLNLGIALLN